MTARKLCPWWCGNEHPGYLVPRNVWCSTDCKDAGRPLNGDVVNTPASPSTGQHWGCDRCAELVPHSDPRLQERIARCDYSCTSSTCGGLMRWQPPASPSTKTPAAGCGRMMRMASPDHPVRCGTHDGGNLEYCSADCRAGVPYVPPIERCSCAEALRLRAALEKLLADLDGSRCDAKCRVDGCENPACRCCCECYLHEITECPSVSKLLRGMDIRSMDYLARIARRALALEPEGAE